MLKLVAHLIVAAVIIIGGGRFDVAGWVTGIAVVGGFVAVHFAWEHYFRNPFELLGAFPISDDDPLMVAAKFEAKASWQAFLLVYPEHRQDCIIKFRLATTDDSVENVWGDLLEIDSESAKVYLRTLPVAEMDLPDRNLVIPAEDIVDWQIEFQDGTLRGGFTMRATFRIFEREEGYMPPAFLEQLARYKPLESSAAQLS